jgi:branched-chain amino acid transport system substrate-binding protein
MTAHRWPASILSFALLLSACGGAAAPASSPATAPSTAAAKPASAAAASASAKPGASAEAKPAGSAPAAAKPAGSAAAGGPIRLGFVNPLTGPQGQAGLDYNDAWKLWLDSANGTIAGRKVDAQYVDDQAQADVGLTKTKQLVDNQKVHALVGFTFTPVVYAVATYVKDTAHIPMLATTGAAGQGLMLDPKFLSDYLMRFSTVAVAHADTSADWAYKQGFRKMVVVTYDTAAGVESGDLVASAFISRGGTVVQEFHPPFGSTDFGPYLAKLDPSADVVAVWEPAADGVRFLQQFGNYVGQKRPTVIDMGGVATAGALGTLKDAAGGVISEASWVDTIDNPENQAFLKAWRAKYPDREPGPLSAQGYGTGPILRAALEKINGNAEDTQAFLKALYATDVLTATGQVKLEPTTHDVVRSYYIARIAKKGNNYGYDLLTEYKEVSQFWDRKPDDLKAFPYGKLKDKWVGMTKDQLAQQHGLTETPK